MATLGLFANSNTGTNASSKTLSVTCTAGSNTGLFVVCSMGDTVNFGNATYKNSSGNVVTMQKIGNRRYNSPAIRQCGYWLPDPLTGVATNFTVSFTGGQFNPMSIYAQSFTDVTQSNLTNELSNGLAATPHSQNMTIADGSIIYLTGVSTQAMSFPYVIAGSNASLNLNQHNVNGKIISGAYSGTGLSAGTYACVTKSDSGSISNHRWEIGGTGGGGGTGANDSDFFMVL